MDNFQIILWGVVLIIVIGYSVYRKAKAKSNPDNPVNPGDLLTILINSIYDKKPLIDRILAAHSDSEEDINFIVKEVAQAIQFEVLETPYIDSDIKKLITNMPLDDLLKIVGRLIEQLVQEAIAKKKQVSDNAVTLTDEVTDTPKVKGQ